MIELERTFQEEKKRMIKMIIVIEMIEVKKMKKKNIILIEDHLIHLIHLIQLIIYTNLIRKIKLGEEKDIMHLEQIEEMIKKTLNITGYKYNY